MAFPLTVLQSQVEILLRQLPAVRDADVESVHTARVATRRLREALPLFSRSYPTDVKRVKRVVKRAGRQLGRVREFDVMEEDLLRRAGRMPMAMPAIDAARSTLARRKDAARRRMVKTLDRLRLDARDRLKLLHRGNWWRPFSGPALGWQRLLRDRIERRVGDLNRAIDHAGGVYFPNRLHAVRIAAKKLRYSLELGNAAGLWHDEGPAADLKRTQETLGRIHDAQVLLDTLDDLVRDEAGEREVTMLKDDLRGEIAERHAKYLAQREQLRAAASRAWVDAAALVPRRRPVMPLVALSAAAAVPTGLLLLGSRDR